ncbi:hypothetical protein HOI30_00260, partial [Candidatus Woesearchaeota archaeon]|nr:hypothetical protein [Candidatus Woesearchaeota archaeon]
MKIINQIINIYLCEIKKIYDGFEDNTIINIILFEMANFNYKEKNFYFHLINSNDKYKEIKNQLILFNDKTKIMSHIYKEENGQLFEDLIKNKFSKQLIKKIKDHLRHIYFMFQTKHYNKINTLFETFKNELINNQEIKLNNLLSVHSSTYERKNFYEEFYNKINEFVNLNECESIMDLGCGFNPFSYTYFNLNNKKLYLNELNTNDLNILKRLSQVYKLKFNTNTKIIEKNIFEIEKFEKVDICFLL